MQEVLKEGHKQNLDSLRVLQQQKRSGTVLTPWPLDRFVGISLLRRDLTKLNDSQMRQLTESGRDVADLYYLPENQT